MRWPWQRKEPEPVAGTPEATPSAAPPRPPADPVPSPAGWAFLPPLQRAMGDLETTTAPHRFADRLPTRVDPSFTGTMSHLLSADAPPGVIDLDGPDAGPVPDTTGSAGRAVELPLLPPPAPHSARQGPTVQRATSSTSTAQRSLTTVPAEDFGALQVPVMPEPATPEDPPTPDAPATPEGVGTGTGTAGEDAEPSSTDTNDGTADAAPPTGPAGAAPVDVTALGTAPDRGPARGPDAAERPGPAPAGGPLPLQRRGPDLPGPTSGDPSGSTFDGTATFVPLPDRAPLQRSPGTASSPATPSSGPVRSAPRAAPPPSGRLGLGRPWPDPVGSPLSAEEVVVPPTPVDEAMPPAAQRATASPELPVTRSAAPLDRVPAPHGPESAAAPSEQEHLDSAAAAPVAETGPGGSPGDDGPAPASHHDLPPQAAAFPEPVVSRSAVAERDTPPQEPAPGDPASSTTGSAVPYTAPAGALRVPFADPPLSAGRQSPDLLRSEAMPVVSRSTAGASVPTARVDAVASPPQDARDGTDGRSGAAPAPVPASEVAPVPGRSAAVLPHDTVQRSAKPGTRARGEWSPAPGTAATVVSAAQDPPGPHAAAEPPGLLGAPAVAPADLAVGRARPAELPVVSRSSGPSGAATAVPAEAGAEAVGPAAADVADESRGTSGAGPAHEGPVPPVSTDSDPVVTRTAFAQPALAAPTSSASPSSGAPPWATTSAGPGGPDPRGTAPLGPALALPSSPPVQRAARPGNASTARPPDETSPRGLSSGTSPGRPAVGTSSGTVPQASAAPPLQRHRASPPSHPARPLGLRPPLSGTVVSRAVGDAQASPATVPLVTAPRPGASSASVTVPTVARTAAPDPALPHGSPAASTPGSGIGAEVGIGAGTGLGAGGRGATDGRTETGEPGIVVADPAAESTLDEMPVLAASASTAVLPTGDASGAPAPYGAGPAPVGVLQRATRGGEPPHAAGRQLSMGSGPTGTEPMAMRLTATEAAGGTRHGEPPASAAAGSPTGPAPVQRDAADVAPAAAAPATAATSEAPAAPARTAAAPAAPGDEGLSQEQVEELAKRLVGPIVRRIKADMLLDRERRGLRIDAS